MRLKLPLGSEGDAFQRVGGGKTCLFFLPKKLWNELFCGGGVLVPAQQDTAGLEPKSWNIWCSMRSDGSSREQLPDLFGVIGEAASLLPQRGIPAADPPSLPTPFI